MSGVFGVKGWVKVRSDTDPRESIAEFDEWVLRSDENERIVALESARPHSRTVIAKIKCIDDRDAAKGLVGLEIAVPREALASCEPGEYYWTDLVTLEVVTGEGVSLGRVDYLFETGGHDVMVVVGDRERLIPFVNGRIVREVDVDRGVIVVEWDPSY